MIFLKLNQYEVLTLSSYSKIQIATNSPLASHAILEAIDYNEQGYVNAIESFKENGFLKEEEGGLTLADEMEPAFLMLHQPDVSISIKRVREVNISEVNFSFKHGFAIQYIADGTGKQHIFNYPHVLPSVGSWIRQEVFVDLDFGDEPLDRHQFNLTMPEMMALFIYMKYIGMRVEHKQDKLTPEECLIAMEAIKQFDQMDELSNLMVRYVGDEVLKNQLQTTDEVDQGLAGLVSKGLFHAIGDEYALTDYGKALFNPGNMRECYLIGEYLPSEQFLTTVNVVKGGYMLLRTLPQEGPPMVAFHICPPSTDVLDLMQIACPVAFKEGFGDEAAYAKRLEDNQKAFMDQVTTRQPSEKFCVQCGNPLTLDARFCSNCGSQQP